jgi:N-acetylglucosamine-6-phosphate deacetylase
MNERKTILLTNGRIILPDVIVNGSVSVIGDRIADVWLKSENVAADEVIDLDGAYLAPGMIDIHIHGSAGIDLMEATAGDMETWARFLLSQGVTRFLPTTVPSDDAAYARVIRTVAEHLARQDTLADAARVIGLHFEGPFVNPHRSGALNQKHLRAFRTLDDASFLLDETVAARPFVRLTTLAPEIAGGFELITELVKRGVVVSIGHSQASFEDCDDAARRGAHHITHFLNALDQLHHRQPGVIGWGLLRDSTTLELIADGFHVEWKIIELVKKVKSADRVALVSDAIAAAGLGDGEYKIWGETIRVSDGQTANAAGTLAGSVISLHDAICNLRRLGFPLTDVMKMASLVPARVIGLDGELGSIERGKLADLICFDEQLSIKWAMVAGSVQKTSTD